MQCLLLHHQLRISPAHDGNTEITFRLTQINNEVTKKGNVMKLSISTGMKLRNPEEFNTAGA